MGHCNSDVQVLGHSDARKWQLIMTQVSLARGSKRLKCQRRRARKIPGKSTSQGFNRIF
jgi:hypothetical protein